MSAPLVSSAWLAERLADPALLVLDIRSAESGGAAAFEAGHLPGAVHSDYAADGWRVQRDGAGGLLPSADELAALFARAGLTPERHVAVISAGQAPADFSAAARVYWTLKVAGHRPVSILDGGHAAWVADGRPVESGSSRAVAAEPYPVRLDSALRAQVSDVEEDIASGAVLLDGRSRAQFEGAEKSPQALRGGRLPGATHLDHARAFRTGTGRLLPKEELERLFAQVPAGRTVSYCNTGHLASTNWFILSEVLGRPGVALYDGSMSEWTQSPERPVETGPAQT